MTIKEAYLKLPPLYRGIAYIEYDKAEKEYQSTIREYRCASSALIHSFTFSDSPLGHEFWWAIYENLIYIEDAKNTNK